MKKLSIFTGKNQIYLFDGSSAKEIFNLKSYKDIYIKYPSVEYKIFEKIQNEYGITNSNDFKDNFSYLFNIVLISNIASYIIDEYEVGAFEELVFDEKIKKTKTPTIKFSDILGLEDILGGVILCLINSKSYLEKDMKIDYKIIKEKNNIESYSSEDIETLFSYQKHNIRDLIERLKIDLVAFGFSEKDQIVEEGKYSLPIYVDYESLNEKNLNNHNEFIENWKSIAYLKMIKQIHEYFSKYYETGDNKGLISDDLMIALINLLDYEEKPMPQGLKKSIEVGRATSGKCSIINTVETPIGLPQDLALSLQSKDLFSMAPKIYLNNM